MRGRMCAAALTLLFGTNGFAADQCPPLTLLTSIDLTASEDGRAEFVPVEIAGVPKLMLLDLGAEISTLSAQVAEELKLPVRKSGVELYDLTGASTDRTTTTELKLGRFRGRRGFMITSLGAGDDPAVVGLLGSDILSPYDLSIDFGTNKLELLDKNHCEGKVVYWPSDAVAIIPFTSWHTGKIVFDITLDGKSMKAILDTGAWQSTLSLPVAERRFDLKPGAADTPKSGVLNGQATLPTYSHTFKLLDFNGVAVANPNFDLIPDVMARRLTPAPVLDSNIPARDDAVQAPVLIGMNILKHLHIYIAYKEKKLYITPAGKPPGK